MNRVIDALLERVERALQRRRARRIAMSPIIEAYLARVERALWLRRRWRREVVAELREHLETALHEAEPSTVEEIELRFGNPETLAQGISAERPFWQARAPLMPGALLILYAVAAPLAAHLLQEQRLLASLLTQSLFAVVLAACVAVARSGAPRAQIFVTALKPLWLWFGVLAITLGVGLRAHLDVWRLLLLPQLGTMAYLTPLCLAVGFVPWWKLTHPDAGRFVRAAVALVPVLAFLAAHALAHALRAGASGAWPAMTFDRQLIGLAIFLAIGIYGVSLRIRPIAAPPLAPA